MKHYYAQIDWTARKANPGYGFANTKRATFFNSETERDRYVSIRSTWDYSCKKLKLSEAIKYREEVFDAGIGLFSPEHYDGSEERTDNFLLIGNQPIWAR